MRGVTFTCDKCGACCRYLRLFGKPYEWLVDDVTGACRYFDPATNLCTIYPVRPLICNMETGYHMFFSHMPVEEFIAQNQRACRLLKNVAACHKDADAGS